MKKITQELMTQYGNMLAQQALLKVQCILIEILNAKITGCDIPEDPEDLIAYISTRITELSKEYK